MRKNLRRLSAIVSLLSMSIGMSACEPTGAQVKKFIGDVESGIEFVVDQFQELGQHLEVTYRFDVNEKYCLFKRFKGSIHADLDNDGKTEEYSIYTGRVIKEVRYVGSDGKTQLIDDSDFTDFDHLVDKSGKICFEGVHDIYYMGVIGVPFRIDTDSSFPQHKYFSIHTSDGKQLRFVNGKQVFAQFTNNVLDMGYWSLDGKFDENNPYKSHTLLAVVGDEEPQAETPYAGTKEKIVTEDGKDVFGGWHDKVLEVFYQCSYPDPDLPYPSLSDLSGWKSWRKSWELASYALVVHDRKLVYYDKDGTAVSDEKMIHELDGWSKTMEGLTQQGFGALTLNTKN